MSRRGRTRKSGRRTACGKLVQAKAEERADKVRAVVTEARQRVHGLSEAQAATHEAGSVLGRLRLSHRNGEPLIAHHQYEAGNEYRRVVEDFRWAIGVRPLSSPGNLNKSWAHESLEETEAQSRARQYARERHRECRQALVTCGAPLAPMVVEAVVIEEKDMPSFIEELRAGLEALAKVLRIERREAA